MNLELTSRAFKSGATIPTRHSCEGENISPPLTWRGVPREAKSLVLICDDPDAPNGVWSHWVLYEIPMEVSELPEGAPSEPRLSWGGMQGRNDFGNAKYEGPCPPPGPAHHYYFRLYALDQSLNLPSGATRAQVLDRIQGHIVASTELLGLYARG